MFIHINRHHTYSCTKTLAHVFIGCLLRFAEENPIPSELENVLDKNK